MNDLIFRPIIPLSTMIPFSIILLLIVLINRKHVINRLLIIILLLIITQRPMLKNQDDVSYVQNFDIVFIIDTTVSMNAIDMGGNTRLSEVKLRCNEILDKFLGSQFSIITYDNEAFIKYPFTEDMAVIKDIIDSLKIIEPNYALGSTLSLPANFLKMLLESSDSKKELHDDKKKKIVFFMGDGELSNYEKELNNMDLYNGIDALIDNGAVMGFGTTEGGKIKITETINKDKLVDSNDFLLDNSVKPPIPAISKLNEQNLKDLAGKLNIEYMQGDKESLERKIDEIINDVIQEESEDDTKNDKDLYYYFTIALLVLMIYELFYYRRAEL